MAIQKPILI